VKIKHKRERYVTLKKEKTHDFNLFVFLAPIGLYNTGNDGLCILGYVMNDDLWVTFHTSYYYFENM
jgi:hypothetical protein